MDVHITHNITITFTKRMNLLRECGMIIPMGTIVICKHDVNNEMSNTLKYLI